ncbi:type II CAAX prenyl endopeptidase Rce1 family protein [Corynebacterium choanae]|uniref:CAAX amino terminal protease self-immunity n=1 Tax=Corynebacterium choanae TaxID=1862358 RepID=A0A3G6J3T1_9CORY|nr:CPBP family intramembrane glutamic endopeptidase [Corynebacterium choanae]AZA12741.1 CAAX amino terminal protease self- immunity [Corynebacterium choanae]
MRRDYGRILRLIAIYYLLAATGFGIAHYGFGINYTDQAMMLAGIPMMGVLAGVVWWNLRTLHPQWNTWRQFTWRWDYTPIAAVPILTLLGVVSTYVEAAIAGTFSWVLPAATVVAACIGFAEEGMFRRLILDMPAARSSLGGMILAFATSVISFALLHMMNVFAGLSISDAWNQTLYTVRFGVVAALIYLVTRNFVAVAVWHMGIDYSLFVSQVGVFRADAILGLGVDWICKITTILCLCYALVGLYRWWKAGHRGAPQLNPWATHTL